MANPVYLLKQLGAASSNSIALSQSASAGVALTLNGAATPYLSTTTTAAVVAGKTVVPLNSVTGLVPGQTVVDSTTPGGIPPGTLIQAVGTSSITLTKPVGFAGIGNGDTIVATGPATIDTATAANVAIGRRVIIAYTGTDTNFNIVGTNSTGNSITDIAVGSGGSAQSNLDFVTVTSITPVGGGLTGVTAGTSSVGSTPWILMNYQAMPPMNVGLAVELVSGAGNYSVEYTYDDPNNLPPGTGYPVPFPHPVLNNQNATLDGAQATTVAAIRLTINSGTGAFKARVLQGGIG